MKASLISVALARAALLGSKDAAEGRSKRIRAGGQSSAQKPNDEAVEAAGGYVHNSAGVPPPVEALRPTTLDKYMHNMSNTNEGRAIESAPSAANAAINSSFHERSSRTLQIRSNLSNNGSASANMTSTDRSLLSTGKRFLHAGPAALLELNESQHTTDGVHYTPGTVTASYQTAQKNLRVKGELDVRLAAEGPARVLAQPPFDWQNLTQVTAGGGVYGTAPEAIFPMGAGATSWATMNSSTTGLQGGDALAAGMNANYQSSALSGLVSTVQRSSVNSVTGLPTNPLSLLEVASIAKSGDETQTATARQRSQSLLEAPGVMVARSWAKLRDLQRATQSGQPAPPTSFLDKIVSNDRLAVERDSSAMMSATERLLNASQADASADLMGIPARVFGIPADFINTRVRKAELIDINVDAPVTDFKAFMERIEARVPERSFCEYATYAYKIDPTWPVPKKFSAACKKKTSTTPAPTAAERLLLGPR